MEGFVGLCRTCQGQILRCRHSSFLMTCLACGWPAPWPGGSPKKKNSPKTSRPWEFRTITKLTWMQVEKSQKPMLVSTWTYLLLMVATHAPHHPSSGQTFDVCQRDACKTLKSGKKNAKRLTWLWKSFVAVTAPVNEDVHSKSHLCVFAFNETKTLGPTRVSKNSNFCSCSEVLWRSKQLTSWKDSAFSAVLYQGSDLTFIVVSNQSLLIQAFACRGMSSPSCQVAIVSFFTFWRGGGVLLIFLDQFAKAFNCESTLATNNLQLIYRILLVHL